MPKLKFLVFDIETGPNLSYTWGKYQQDVIAFKEEWDLLSFAYKWLGEKPVYAYGADKNTEEAIVNKLWLLFDEADVLIAHNGYKFDIRKVNAKFLEYGLTPPSPYKVVDTLRVSRRYFALNSNKLDDLGELLQVGRKVKHEGFELWLKCMAGDKAGWKKMLQYNKQDVVLLEKVYLKLLPWITNHPNRGDLSQLDGVCPKCESKHLSPRGYINTRTGKKQRYCCDDCGGWSSEASIKRTGRVVNTP